MKERDVGMDRGGDGPGKRERQSKIGRKGKIERDGKRGDRQRELERGDGEKKGERVYIHRRVKRTRR